MALDYGEKRTGVAVTDVLQMIAGGLETIETSKLMPFLRDYLSREPVSELVVGLPLNNRSMDTEQQIQLFLTKFTTEFPNLPVMRMDERFTSKIASGEILKAGLSKKQRSNKKLIDQVSAVIILQDYLKYRK